MPGPLPTENPRRRNAPTIPTTKLPASGRQGDVPKVPGWVVLESNGLAWWEWAWKTPQAAGWASGHEAVVARRASLEDKDDTSALLREKRELDDRLGLTPKGMAALRWTVVDDSVEESTPAGVANLDDRRARLSDAS